MNAKQTIKAVMACNSLEELNAFSSDERKTVKEAVDQRTKELSDLTVSKPEAPTTAVAVETVTDEKPSEENEAIAPKPVDAFFKFRQKLPIICRCTEIIRFAHEFFGDKLKSAIHDKEKSHAVLTLKTGETISLRGV